MTWIICIAIVLGVVASAEDLWRRRVSNILTGPALVIGVIAHSVLSGWDGAIDSTLGALIGFVVFFVFFLMGGMGGGDVKLMAAFGAILGRGQIVTAAIMAALVGGVIAVAYLGGKKLWRAVGKKDASGTPDRKDFIPYAPAISLGALLSFLGEEDIWTSVS